ncbi:hypothetical protein Y1Q_0005340 [Alligator mississippiensis]|uniref:peptide-methionine (S)-S-oxide reductase n=1 Tax=Alligator mississippiensis TaxID=8496 RepID=A0A151MVL5_ALLMI|nr:hypothetical protein Y1Q_0005340 [Alligator mississippiensis]
MPLRRAPLTAICRGEFQGYWRPWRRLQILTILLFVLTESGFGTITTEIREAPEFFYAEDYHQQYLSKNPNGYCGLGGTGVSCPLGTGK